jgi:hypothetical protein
VRVLKDQGAFIERIQWAERVFIPAGENGSEVFSRITASKPVVDLIEKTSVSAPLPQQTPEQNDEDDDDNFAPR